MRVTSSPGACPICGASHTTCTARRGPITSVQFPARDAALVAEVEPPPLVAEVIQPTLAPGQFTTATYRGRKKLGEGHGPA